MKKIIFTALLILGAITIKAQEINWVTFEEAIELQKTNPKNIFMDMYTVWCGPCKMLDKNTFKNKSVAAYINENYYAVKFNAEGNDEITFKGQKFTNPKYNPSNTERRNSAHQFSSYFGVRAYPTIVFLDENGMLITPLPGYRTPRQLEIFLKLFKDDTYKKVKTKEEFTKYSENFKYDFIE